MMELKEEDLKQKQSKHDNEDEEDEPLTKNNL